VVDWWILKLKTIGEAPAVNFIKRRKYVQQNKGRRNVQEGLAQGLA
jgi:hypothetical protein